MQTRYERFMRESRLPSSFGFQGSDSSSSSRSSDYESPGDMEEWIKISRKIDLDSDSMPEEESCFEAEQHKPEILKKVPKKSQQAQVQQKHKVNSDCRRKSTSFQPFASFQKKPFACRKCRRTYKHKSSLTVHLRQHNGKFRNLVLIIIFT